MSKLTSFSARVRTRSRPTTRSYCIDNARATTPLLETASWLVVVVATFIIMGLVLVEGETRAASNQPQIGSNRGGIVSALQVARKRPVTADVEAGLDRLAARGLVLAPARDAGG
jgi:hypothetical protein